MCRPSAGGRRAGAPSPFSPGVDDRKLCSCIDVLTLQNIDEALLNSPNLLTSPANLTPAPTSFTGATTSQQSHIWNNLMAWGFHSLAGAETFAPVAAS